MAVVAALLTMAVLNGCAASDNDNELDDGDEEAADDADAPDGDEDVVEDGDAEAPDGDSDGDDEAIEEEETDEGSGFPEAICKAPPALTAGSWFRRATEEVGIAPDQLAVTGNRLAAVDLDGDDYPDLVVHNVASMMRDDLEADPPVRYKRVLLNRPDPNDATKRVFIDVTDESGYTAIRDGGLGRAANFAIFADLDNDGALDAFSGAYIDKANPQNDPGDRSEILLGDGEGNFSLAEASATTPGPEDLWSTTSAAFTDVNLDGILDIWVGFFYEEWGYLPGLQNRLYIGQGDGTFEDDTDTWNLTTTYRGFDEGDNHKPTYGATVCDVNDDGRPDLVGSSYGRQFNELWRNDGEQFADVSQSSRFASDDNLDFSDNEFYKCYCTVHACDPDPGEPRVQCPLPADSYWSEDDEKSYRLGGNTFTTVCGDWTGDGLPDLFNAEIAHWHIGQSSDPSQLLVNASEDDEILFERPGREATGLVRNHTGSDWNEGDITAMRFDFDLDGYPDLYLGNSDYPGAWGLLFRQIDDGLFQDVTSPSGARHSRANGLAWADFDRDGDLDFVVGSSLARESPWTTAEVHYYRNDVGQDSNAIRLTLIGNGAGSANKSAVGARVKVKTGGRTQTEWVEAGYGHFGMQHEIPLTIGLGAACAIDELEIRWPDSELTVQKWEDVPANYHVTIEEGGEPLFAPLALQ